MTDFHILLLPILLLKTFMTYTTGRNFTVGLLIPYTTPVTSSADLFGIRYAPASLLALENIIACDVYGERGEEYSKKVYTERLHP